MRINRGIGINAVYLITRCVSGASLFIGAGAMVTINIFSGIAYAICGIGAFLLFGAIFKHYAQHNVIDIKQSSELFFEKQLFSKRGKELFQLIVFVVNSLTLYLQGLVGAILINSLTGIPIPFGFLIYSIVGYCLVYLDGWNWSIRYKIYPVALFLVSLILLLVYFFLLNGLQQVFNGIQLYHPYLLVYNNPDVIKFMLAAYIVTFIRILFDPLIGEILRKNQHQNWLMSLLLSGFVWSTFPIAFSSLMLGLIYNGGFKNFSSLLFKLNHMGSTNVLVLIFTIFLEMTILSTFVSNLKTFITHTRTKLVTIQGGSPIIKNFISEILLFFSLLVIGLIMTLYYHPSILEILYFCSVTFAAVGIPLIISLLLKAFDNGQLLFISIISVIVGYCFYGNYRLSLMVLAGTALLLSFILIKPGKEVIINQVKKTVP